jgi:Concanavalin A-like lectin/glucanases superfamily
MKHFTRILRLCFAGAVLVGTTSGQGQTFLTNGLVAYYQFSGNANDSSGNGNNGTISNIVFVADRFGVGNSAASFAGNFSNFITLKTNLNLNLPFTVCAWVKFTNAIGGRVVSTAGYELTINGGHAAMNVTFEGGSGTSVQSPQQLPSAVWHHLVGVWNLSGGILYTDGVLAGTYTSFINPSYSRGFIPKLGRNSGSLADSFRGLMDDIRIYNQELSPQEVAQLYQLESGAWISLVKAVRPSFSQLTIGSNYQLQLSSDLITWTNYGAAFTATNTDMPYPQYIDIDWDSLFFRTQVVP